MENKSKLANGCVSGTQQCYALDTESCESMLLEDNGTARANVFEKQLCYIIENNLEKQEITIILPQGKNSITLSELWVHELIEDLTRQTHEWP